VKGLARARHTLCRARKRITIIHIYVCVCVYLTSTSLFLPLIYTLYIYIYVYVCTCADLIERVKFNNVYTPYLKFRPVNFRPFARGDIFRHGVYYYYYYCVGTAVRAYIVVFVTFSQRNEQKNKKKTKMKYRSIVAENTRTRTK